MECSELLGDEKTWGERDGGGKEIGCGMPAFSQAVKQGARIIEERHFRLEQE